MNQNKLNSNSGGRFTEGWIPIKQILNGMIQLDSGEYVTGVKVAPKNIFIMDQDNQNGIICSLSKTILSGTRSGKVPRGMQPPKQSASFLPV